MTYRDKASDYVIHNARYNSDLLKPYYTRYGGQFVCAIDTDLLVEGVAELMRKEDREKRKEQS